MKFGQILGGLGGGLLLGALNSGKHPMSFGQMAQGMFNPLGLLGEWGGGKHPLFDPAEAIPGLLDPSQLMGINMLGRLGGGR